MKRLFLTALIAAAFTSAAHAEGPYIGADVVLGHYGFDVAGATSSNDSANNVGGRILIGYDFNQTWAIEGGYADFGMARYNFTAFGTNGSLEASSHSLYMAAKGSIPINETFSLYGKLGAARNDVDREGSSSGAGLTQSFTGGALYAGIGAQYKLNEKAAITLELEHFGPLDSVGGTTFLVSTGVRYSF